MPCGVAFHLRRVWRGVTFFLQGSFKKRFVLLELTKVIFLLFYLSYVSLCAVGQRQLLAYYIVKKNNLYICMFLFLWESSSLSPDVGANFRSENIRNPNEQARGLIGERMFSTCDRTLSLSTACGAVA